MAKAGRKREPSIDFIELNDDQRARFGVNYGVAPNTNCWLWHGTIIGGYGRFVVDGNSRLAHRVSWMLKNGAIPKGLQINHKCFTKWCVNPDHLYAGTAEQNTCDAVVAGTAKIQKGSLNIKSKLTEEQVREIRSAKYSDKSTREIGRIFGVSGMAISNIKTGKSWGWLK